MLRAYFSIWIDLSPSKSVFRLLIERSWLTVEIRYCYSYSRKWRLTTQDPGHWPSCLDRAGTVIAAWLPFLASFL